MNREWAFSLISQIQRARSDMDVNEPLDFVRAAVASGRQRPFVYDVLAFLEEAAEDAGYDKFKALLTAAIKIINASLEGS